MRILKVCSAAAASLALLSAEPSVAATQQSVEPKTPGAPQFAHALPPLDTVALASEQQVLDTFLSKVRESDRTPSTTLAAADQALASLHSPTALRGLVEFVRAEALSSLGRDLDAAVAAEESVRLLPGYGAPLIKAFTLNAYLGRTAEATEYLMRATTVDPTTARMIDDYEINNLLRRLHGVHDEQRARVICDRLLEIGWLGKHFGSRSELAFEAIQLHVQNGDIAGAKALVPNLTEPGNSRDLLIMNAYAQLWPDIEAWAGPRLERQWALYLRETRDRWAGGRTAAAARDYVAAAKASGRYEEALREVLPLLDRPQTRDEDLVFLVAPLANMLAHLGQWTRAEAVFERAQENWPLGSSANALNVSANYALLSLEEGQSDKALTLMDASLADARRWGPQVGPTPMARMEHSRACILHTLGRDREARISMTEALGVERGVAAAMLHLCMGDPATAKHVLLGALDNELEREDVLRFMQLPDEAPDPSAYERQQRAATDALRADPELQHAIAVYGRVLPWRTNEVVLSDPGSAKGAPQNDHSVTGR